MNYNISFVSYTPPGLPKWGGAEVPHLGDLGGNKANILFGSLI